MLRTNSIISDPEPTVPALSGAPKKPKTQPTDYERIANSEEYPQFVHYLDERIKHFQRYTPDGREIEGLSIQERLEGWNTAVVIIKEFEALKNTLLAFKKKNG